MKILLYISILLFGQPLVALQTLQSLINRSSSGDTLRIDGGIYNENISIAKKLHLIGINSPVIHGTGKGSVVTILVDSCSFSGFIVEHSGSNLADDESGVMVKSSHNSISRNIIRDILFGIYFLQADSNSATDNTVVGRANIESGQRGSGMHLWDSHHNTFERNEIRSTRDGFYILYANHTHMYDNEVSDLRYGVHYMYADSNIFLRNSFHDNVAGAAIMYSRGITMKHNQFFRNRGFSSYGVLFQDCHNSVADSNIFMDNVVGIFLESSTDNTLFNNIIAHNDVALYIFQNSINNTVVQNNFIDNLSPLTLVGKMTETQWSLNDRGNYWSSYDGYDIEGDGVGDIPMKIQNVFNYLEGRNSNVRLFLYSPASQALAVSAKAFPIIDINKEVDQNPLMYPVDMSWTQSLVPRSSTGKIVRSQGASVLGFIIPGIAFLSIGFLLFRIKKNRK